MAGDAAKSERRQTCHIRDRRGWVFDAATSERRQTCRVRDGRGWVFYEFRPRPTQTTRARDRARAWGNGAFHPDAEIQL